MIYVQGSSFILLCTKKMGLQWVDCIVFVDFNLFFFFYLDKSALPAEIFGELFFQAD